MLLHLPIAILATLSPIVVSDTVPKFDIGRECRFEGGSLDRCSQDETAALRQLQEVWPKAGAAQKRTCTIESTIAGITSYVELLVCLEMNGQIERQKNSSV